MSINLKLEFEEICKKVRFSGSTLKELTALCQKSFPNLKGNQFYMVYKEGNEVLSISDDSDVEGLLDSGSAATSKVEIKMDLLINSQLEADIIKLEESIRAPEETPGQKMEGFFAFEKVKEGGNEASKSPETGESGRKQEQKMERIDDNEDKGKTGEIKKDLEKALEVKRKKKMDLNEIVQEKVKDLLPFIIESVRKEVEKTQVAPKIQKESQQNLELDAKFLREVASHPLNPTYNDEFIHKTIEILNCGKYQWTPECEIRTTAGSAVKLPLIKPGEKCLVVLTFKNMECPEFLQKFSFFQKDEEFGESFKLKMVNFSQKRLQEKPALFHEPKKREKKPIFSKEKDSDWIREKASVIVELLGTNLEKTMEFVASHKAFQKEELLDNLLSDESLLNNLK